MPAHTEKGEAIVSSWRRSAVHFVTTGAPGPWGGPPLQRIACGRAILLDPERLTTEPRYVTCDACRMHPDFAAARRGSEVEDEPANGLFEAGL